MISIALNDHSAPILLTCRDTGHYTERNFRHHPQRAGGSLSGKRPLDLLYLRRVLGSSRATANDLDRLFHALADPARRAVVERLSRGPAVVSELARPLPMSLPAAMQHLGVLELARVGGSGRLKVTIRWSSYPLGRR